jgi:hypothetical protein
MTKGKAIKRFCTERGGPPPLPSPRHDIGLFCSKARHLGKVTAMAQQLYFHHHDGSIRLLFAKISNRLIVYPQIFCIHLRVGKARTFSLCRQVNSLFIRIYWNGFKRFHNVIE